MAKSKDPDDCPICGLEIEVKGKIGGKWYDDKNYDTICYICAATIKQVREEKGEWHVCENVDRVYMRTPEEMKELGWGRDKEAMKRVDISIKAVKAALKKAKKIVTS